MPTGKGTWVPSKVSSHFVASSLNKNRGSNFKWLPGLYIMFQAGKNTCNVRDEWILKEIYTWSPALGPSVLKRIGLQRLSSFIKLEFWKWAMRAAFPCIRAYASDATFSLLNFSHFFPSNTCQNCIISFSLLVQGMCVCVCECYVIISLTAIILIVIIIFHSIPDRMV